MPGKHDVEHDHVGARLRRQPEAVVAVVGDLDRVSLASPARD